MRHRVWPLGVVGGILVFGSAVLGQEPAGPAAENAKYVAELKQKIAGHEKEPAKQVFKNLKILADAPAERLLGIMEQGWARSLGVACTHCHVPGQWDSDEKPPKQIAREMTALVRTIRDQLKAIEPLGNQNPNLNCTTCHRGQLKPATSL